MGLLQHILETDLSTQKGDLISKAEYLSKKENNKISFFEWAEQQEFAHLGIFLYECNKYVLSYAFNIDSQTIINSVSTYDFWQNILTFQNNIWQTFDSSSSDFNKFYQFFSGNIKDQIKTIYILKLSSIIISPNEKQPFIFCYSLTNEIQQTLSPFSKNDINKISLIINSSIREDSFFYKNQFSNFPFNRELLPKDSLVPFCFTFTFKSLISEIFQNIKISDISLKKSISDSIFTEACFYLIKAFSAFHYFTFFNDYKLKITFFTSVYPDNELFRFHITKILSPLFSSNLEKLQLSISQIDVSSLKHDLSDSQE